MDWFIAIGEAHFSPINVGAFGTLFLTLLLVSTNLFLHLNSNLTLASNSGTRFHTLITVSLSLYLTSQILAIPFRYFQLSTEQRFNYTVRPGDVLLGTKITGCGNIATMTSAGFIYELSSLDRFKPFADGFGFPAPTVWVLSAIAGAGSAASVVGGCLFAAEIRSRALAGVNSLFWAIAAILELFINFSMLHATVTRKRVVFAPDSSNGLENESSNGRPSLVSRPAEQTQKVSHYGWIATTIRSMIPTLKRSNRTLIVLVVGCLVLDFVAFGFFLGQLYFRRYFVSMGMFLQQTLGMLIMLDFVFLSMFRNVLRVDKGSDRPKTGWFSRLTGADAPAHSLRHKSSQTIELSTHFSTMQPADDDGGGSIYTGSLPRSGSTVLASTRLGSSLASSARNIGAPNVDVHSLNPVSISFPPEAYSEFPTADRTRTQDSSYFELGTSSPRARDWEFSAFEASSPGTDISTLRQKLSSISIQSDVLSEPPPASNWPTRLYSRPSATQLSQLTREPGALRGSPISPPFSPQSGDVKLPLNVPSAVPNLAIAHRPPERIAQNFSSSFNHVRPADALVLSVVNSFTGSREDEINLTPGEQVECWYTWADGWAFGLNHSTLQKGVFPLQACISSDSKHPETMESNPSSQIVPMESRR
ncbi:hypothetical protein BJ742DRAFT_806618 [Cladochytrium replicatum]|nr:hypothetical protein BJ742DRAFT_806618 [Cladochytrium replicatum]